MARNHDKYPELDVLLSKVLDAAGRVRTRDDSVFLMTDMVVQAYELGVEKERERSALIAEETDKLFALTRKAVESVRNAK